MAQAESKSTVGTGFQFKSTRAALNELILLESDPALLAPQLAAHAARVPMLFNGMPVVLNLQQLPQLPSAAEAQALIELCRAQTLMPVGIKAEPGSATELCVQLQLADFSQQRRVAEPAPEPAPESSPSQQAAEPETAPEAAPARAAKIVTTPVRSGQQIYARGCDLVILSSVGAGAEVMADGHIHVYGPLRGRAMAGVSGDENTRIFCQSLEAELISIAGYFKTSEDLQTEHWQKPAQALLSGSRLDTVAL
jgi:septum site-determining protein MinC